MLWEGDRCVALIDWNTAGVGDPGVDLGSLRMQVALQYGQDAPAHVLEGWQRQAGRAATSVPYWDAVAALNTPTVMQAWPGFADDGSPLDAEAVTERRERSSATLSISFRHESADRGVRNVADPAKPNQARQVAGTKRVRPEGSDAPSSPEPTNCLLPRRRMWTKGRPRGAVRGDADSA